MLKAFQNPAQVEKEKAEFRAVLEKRYALVKKFTTTHTSENITPLPFNSGYFMAFDTKKVNAETLRQKLLKERGIGTISIDSRTLRVAFSSLEEDKIDIVYKKNCSGVCCSFSSCDNGFMFQKN